MGDGRKGRVRKGLMSWVIGGVALVVLFALVSPFCAGDSGRIGDAPVEARPKGERRVFSDAELDAAEAFFAASVRGDADIVDRLRVWAGTNAVRRMWACDIVRNAGRTNELSVLANDASRAFRDGGATFGRLLRVAKFLEECGDWGAAHDALMRAGALAMRRTQCEDLAFALLRVELASEGPTPARLAALRRIASSAIMKDNRRLAARLLETHGG